MSETKLLGTKMADGAIEQNPNSLDYIVHVARRIAEQCGGTAVPVEIVEAGTAERVKRLEALVREAMPHVQNEFQRFSSTRVFDKTNDWLARAEKELSERLRDRRI